MPARLTYRLEADDGSSVTVADGRIAPPGSGVTHVFHCPGATVLPGLINPHDHLHRNHYPRLGSPPYPDAYAWGADIHARHAEVIRRGRAVDRTDAFLFGVLKNLLSGVTTVVHHDPWDPVLDAGVPIRLARVRVAHSLGLDPDLANARRGDPALPLSIHLCEGTTPGAAREVQALAELGFLDERLIAVHAVGVAADGIERLRAAGSAVVWCPTSNHFLLGETAPAALLTSGVDVLLGSDSLLTADGTLLEELRAARALEVVPDDVLLGGVGTVAARRLRLEPPSTNPGGRADLTLLTRPLLEAGVGDVALVVVGGRPRYGRPEFAPLFALAGAPTESVTVAGTQRLVVAPLGAVARRILADWPDAGRIFG